MDAQPPGLAEILSHWAWDPLWVLVLALPLAWYLHAYRSLAASNPRVPFPRWKPWAFAAGTLCFVIAVLSPVEYYGNQLIWVNFLGFLFLTMLGAPLVLLASPVLLAYRTGTHPRRKALHTFLWSRPWRIATFPPFTWLLFAVLTYIWQFGVPTEWAAENAYVRDLQLATCMAAALLFWAPALNTDPLAWRVAHPLRILYLFVEMTHKALFGAFFLSASRAIHENFAANAPAWAPNPIDDQTMGIIILWLGGNMVFVAVIAGVAVRWIRSDAANARRIDRRLARAAAAARKRSEALEQVFSR